MKQAAKGEVRSDEDLADDVEDVRPLSPSPSPFSTPPLLQNAAFTLLPAALSTLSWRNVYAFWGTLD